MPRKKKTEIEATEAVETNKEEAKMAETEIKEKKETTEPEKKTRGRKKKAEVTETVEATETAAVEEKPKRKRKPRTEVDEKTRDTLVLLKGAKATCSIMSGMIERIDELENAPTPETKVCAILRFLRLI